MGCTQPDKFVVRLSWDASTVNDSTTYYVTILPRLGLSTSTTYGNFICPFTGMIRKAYVSSYSSIVAGTAEDWPMTIRNITTSTDYAIQTIAVANSLREWSNEALAIPVTVGDKLLIKTVSPAFVTNPEGCSGTAHIVFEV